MNKPLVSIIIPTFNRAHLIGETLESVLSQTYSNWECIVVDDGSSDETDKVLAEYCLRDNRFRYYHRPKNRQKGANTCRNFGFEKSKGDYINWFDSDDIMFSDFIEVKITNLLKKPLYDFVITRGFNFNSKGEIKEISTRNNRTKKLDHNNFIRFEVFWITHDFFVKRSRLKKVKFDPEIKSGQEYNFFIKVMAINDLKGFFVDKIVFKRRIHENSIQGNLEGNENAFNFDQYILYRNTFSAASKYMDKKAKAHMFRRVASRTFELKRNRIKTPKLDQIIYIYIEEKGVLKTGLFIFSLCTAYFFGKGFKLMDVSRI